MTEATSVSDLLAGPPPEHQALCAPDAAAPPLSYGALRALAERTVERLDGLGIGRNDRVAMVLPNGPEAAAAFLSFASGATTAPLNPAYRVDEFEFYLRDLHAAAVVVPADVESGAREAAARLGLLVLELRADRAHGAGAFTLEPAGHARRRRPARRGLAQADEIALLLHTSGTTSRPKLVPLLQRNVVASARHIAAALELSGRDVCLNVMPLFHIHGLMAATLASVAAGARVCCAPGFNALRFFSWLGEAQPTWYTAVPTMHQAILARAGRNREALARSRLRLVRSASSSLPPQVMQDLEATFHAPVIEAYGMTEAAHQIASNPLPPRLRRPGTVGLPAGPDVAVVDERGHLLPPGKIGEVMIRGPNVMPGYESNPVANARAFVGGWFRTGDQGMRESDRYLCLSGRIDEIIVRGGEKISPLEVDFVLMDHPAVQQVVTFPVPHGKLGEEVAAVVVLREGKAASERELRGFASERLADFKVPRRILIVPEIPRGATGKFQRVNLATRLHLVNLQRAS